MTGNLVATVHIVRCHGSKLVPAAQIRQVLDMTGRILQAVKGPGQIRMQSAYLTKPLVLGSVAGPAAWRANHDCLSKQVIYFKALSSEPDRNELL